MFMNHVPILFYHFCRIIDATYLHLNSNILLNVDSCMMTVRSVIIRILVKIKELCNTCGAIGLGG